jgi:hypothetical protein
MVLNDSADGLSAISEPDQHFPLAADDRRFVSGLFNLAKWIDPTDLGAENVLADERGDLTEYKKR